MLTMCVQDVKWKRVFVYIFVCLVQIHVYVLYIYYFKGYVCLYLFVEGYFSH